MDDDAMFVTQSNISRFRRLLRDPLPDQMRKTIEGLLAEVEMELMLKTRGFIAVDASGAGDSAFTSVPTL
jgi:hypothetical protein